MRRATAIFCLVFLVAGVLLAERLFGGDPAGSESDIIVSHANHADLACTDCHAAIRESGAAEDRNFPAMDACASCHEIDDEKNCGMCHKNPNEPRSSPHPERNILFSHAKHLGRGAECAACHGDVATSTASLEKYMPSMRQCFSCHDGVKTSNACAVCHGDRLSLVDIHPGEWRHQHSSLAALDRDWCMQCHSRDMSCLECHRGDNLLGNIHDLNYRYTHGLDAKSKLFDCAACHDTGSFCNACHERENRIPLLHSTVGWLTDHGRAARRDVETCAACHESSDPTCSRGGCHRDADGMRGTDPRFHAPGMTMFGQHGVWHGDEGAYCFRCHTDTRRPGEGFCGYCHGDVD